MSEGWKTVAIILAAGAGRRLGAEVAKQYLPLGDRPIVAHTLAAFQACDAVNEILVAVGADDAAPMQSEIITKHGITKCSHVVLGGKERQDSVRNALTVIKNAAVVIVHDGVRPFVDAKMIDGCIAAAREFGASAIGVPLKDTVKVVDVVGFVQETLPRESLWQIQTPQAFRYEVLARAHECAAAEGFYATDDCALVERLGGRVKIVSGSYRNIKITTAEDLLFAQALWEEKGTC